MLSAHDLMRPCTVVPESCTVAEIVSRMTREGESFVAVVSSKGLLTGIITEFDLVRLIYEAGLYEVDFGVVGRPPAHLGWSADQLKGVTAADIMTNNPETVQLSARLEEISRIMFRQRRKVVLVAEAGKVLGAVLRVDLVKKVLG